MAAQAKKAVPLKARVARGLASSKDAREKMVVNYFKCFEAHKQETPLKTCVDRVLSRELSQAQKDRFYSWLVVFDARLSKFKTCSKTKLKEVSFFPEATSHYICGDLDLGNLQKEAVFFFKEQGGPTLRLSSIYY